MRRLKDLVVHRVGLDDVGEQKTEATSAATNQLSHDCDKSTAAGLAMQTHHNDDVLKTDPTCETWN